MRFLDPVGRDEARELARRELEKSIYHRDQPSWLERAWERFSDWLNDLFSRTANPGSPGDPQGWISVAIVIALLVVVVALVIWLMRGRLNVRSDRGALLDEEPSAAQDHRDAAERYAAAGQWAEAIRERLRAIARDLEERVILDPRPGRTADELAAEAGAALPEHAAALTVGVRVFDDVWYGDRPGTQEGYATLTELEQRIRSTRPRPLIADRADSAGTPDGNLGDLQWAAKDGQPVPSATDGRQTRQTPGGSA